MSSERACPLRRFPRLAEALEDGRLCLTTLAQLRPVLTEDNAEDLLARAAFRTTAEVDHLVASLRPRQAPQEGIRLLPDRSGLAARPLPEAASPSRATQPPQVAPPADTASALSAPPPAPQPRTAEMRAVSEEQWSLRVTVDRALKDEAPATVPAELRRQVWERDRGRCAWVGADGKRCNGRWQVEVDHLDPAARGGTARLDRLRLACRLHNLLYAEEVYGREPMRKYRKGESTAAGGSPEVPVAREAQAAG